MSNYLEQGHICVIITLCHYKKQTGSTHHSHPACSPYGLKENLPAAHHRIMITIYIKKCKPLSQKIYDETIDSLQLHTVSCTCGCKGSLIHYGSYERTVKVMSHSIRLRVARVMCRECHHTHALLLSVIVPYSQVMLHDQQDILDTHQSGRPVEPILERNLLIDENTVKYIIRQYRKHWKERLAALGLSLRDELTRPCFADYARQFMQIRRAPNILYP